MNLTFLVFLLFQGVGAFSEDLSKLPVRQETFWKDYKETKIETKVQSAPKEIIEYLRKDNEKQGWPNKPVVGKISDDLLKDIQAALLEIPLNLRQKISNKTVGIFVVEDLGGSAYTDYVFNKKRMPVAGFVVLDSSVMSRRANEWATWKESSPFLPDSIVTLKAIIETPENDNRKNALQYILLHEFGHILSIQNRTVPEWGSDWSKTKINSTMSFFNESWKLTDGKLSSRYDQKWQDRSLISYYAPSSKKLPASKAFEIYQKLFETNFSTLYAATNPFDDFADSFVSFVHSEILKKPWHVKVESKTSKITYELCWREPRCKTKKLILEALVN